MHKIFASIVLYKHSYEDLKPTLDSLLAITSIDKIILIDNDTSLWANSLDDSRLIYIKSEGNFGFGFGHNLAINQYAKDSDFFLICNPDIIFETKQFEQLLNFIKDRPEGLFLPKIIYPDGENQFGARLLPSPLNLFTRRFSKKMAAQLDQQYLLKNYSVDKPIFAPYLSGCFMLFRSESLLDINGFDEHFFMYMEDIDISRRCAERSGVLYCPQFSVIHAHEQASYKNTKLLKAHIKSAVQYFNKWGWIYDEGRSRLNSRCLKQFIK